MSLQWFTPSGKKALRRHEQNQRDQASSRARYKTIIMQRGVMEGLRSELIACMRIENGEQMFYFIAGATLVEAAYEAF